MRLLLLGFFLIVSLFQFKGDNILVDATADEIVQEIQKNKGKQPVMLNFWATWCAPCIEEFPYIMDLHQKYGSEFDLIFVSGDFEEAREEARVFLEKQGVDFTTYFKVGKDDEFIRKISDNWTGALPFTVVYTKDGEVSASWEGKADFKTFESELLKVLN